VQRSNINFQAGRNATAESVDCRRLWACTLHKIGGLERLHLFTVGNSGVIVHVCITRGSLIWISEVTSEWDLKVVYNSHDQPWRGGS
jgi:hypothetical protein